MRQCKNRKCKKPSNTRGYCKPHYQAAMRAGRIKKQQFQHGYAGTRIYTTWIDMRRRCNCKTHAAYDAYGGRGITVCDRWNNSFVDFFADVGEPPTPDHSLDRYPDNDAGYFPGNTRWATQKQQQRNRRSNRMLFFGDTARPMIEWAEHFKIPYPVLQARVAAGWGLIRAFGEPSGTYQNDRANVWPDWKDVEE